MKLEAVRALRSGAGHCMSQREPQLGSGWVQVLPWLIYLGETIELGEIMVAKVL